MTSEKYHEIAEDVNSAFSQYILNYKLIQSPSGRVQKLRFELTNYALIDIQFNTRTGRYSFHYEDEKGYYRHDNAPHYSGISTFPRHYHRNDNIVESHLSNILSKSVIEFFELVIHNFFLTIK